MRFRFRLKRLRLLNSSENLRHLQSKVTDFPTQIALLSERGIPLTETNPDKLRLKDYYSL